MTIESTLEERGQRYGEFEQHASIAQELQDCMRSQGGWRRLAPDQKQALTVIADKIARMLNGDPAYRDNWHDIVGYAKLVDDRMARDEAKNPLGLVPWDLDFSPETANVMLESIDGVRFWATAFAQGCTFWPVGGSFSARGALDLNGQAHWRLISRRPS